MKTKEMVELVQQHHPHMGEVEIIKLLNRVKDDFCEETEIVRDSYTTSTVANQRYYKLPEGLLEIKEVFLNGVRVPRMIGKPIIEDTALEEDNI